MGNLFVVVGNANLDNKMVSLRRIRKCLSSKCLNLLAVVALLWRDNVGQFSVRVAPWRKTAYRILEQFEDTGGVRDKCAGPRRKKLSVQHKRKYPEVQENSAPSGTTDSVSTCAAWKICRDDLSLFPYKMQVSQPLSEDGMSKCCAFEEYRTLLQDNPRVFNGVLVCFRRNPDAIQELETAIQPETEAIYTETLRKVMNN